MKVDRVRPVTAHFGQTPGARAELVRERGCGEPLEGWHERPDIQLAGWRSIRVERARAMLIRRKRKAANARDLGGEQKPMDG
jgi:hypothetical protein